ncbi:uncharacterized protein LOC121985325 [Zingiber officinale]|uniref:uncharacterized protein LOC121985325 n=1 Tax=Zingiber officinale TaxID=94328 RepID=UPI001C4D5C29|nr:uncharacterized protein LOC121985325 [Zingiber officinale]XP_042394632.1 uncharacterized protein LOC121985325 [Zingiber officinale]XP_042394634.1 uncharacterized protein LOC121985325 [Zingiber officinale]
MKNLLSEKSMATPIKILMANDMSNEIELKRKSHSVVAQLMGIDTMKLDQQQVSIHTKRKLQDNCPSTTTLAGKLKVSCQKDKFCNEMSCNLQHYIYDKIESKDACEILHKPSGDIKNQWGNCIKDLNKNNKKAYVENLMEGSFSTEEERILHSKDFQDALRIVCSNRKLFLKILEGPDFILSKHMRNAPITPVKKNHISAFKPLRNFEKGENVVTTERYPSASNNSDFTQLKAKNVSQQTRIVVLKPRSGNHHVMKAKVASPMTLCKLLEQSGFFRGLQDRGALQSRSESEVSQQKLKNVISQKSAVVMEAKKQALERQASLPSNGSNKEQIRTHRSSFSLGQILANTVVKEAEHTNKFIPRNGSSCNPVDELKLSTSFETFGKINYIERSSPGNLSRSKSLPISSSYEQIGSSTQSSKFLISSAIERKKEVKSRNDKTFKEKISSFLFSKMKKFSCEKSGSPFSEGFDSKFHSYSPGLAVKGSVQSVNPLKINLPLGSPQVYYEETSGNATCPNPIIDARKRASSNEKAKACNTMRDEVNFENSKGNQDQTSPTSVLDTLYEDRRNDIISKSSDVITGTQSISRAPPIESVSRSLPRDNTHPDFSIFNKEPFKVDTNHEENYAFSRNFLSSSSAINTTVSTRNHAIRGQFDEVLLTNYFYWREVAAMLKEKRSNQNVLFSSANSEPIEFGSTGLPTSQSVNQWIRESAWLVPAEAWNIIRNSFFVKTVMEDDDCSNISQLLGMMVGGLEVQEITEEISGYVLKNLVREALAEMSD